MPIHIAITRRVLPGREEEFQEALREFFQHSFAHGGVLGATMLVPPPGSDSREFGILRTFASEQERDAFYSSPIFKAWEERCRPLTESDSWTQRPLHGLEAWFRGGEDPRPPRWKMALVTLAGVYPTSLVLGLLLAPALHGLPRAAGTLIMAGVMVLCLTWAVMPALTKMLHSWLHPSNSSSS
jgi:antibiotic biosynthesis monooxygenase (ABM) superfamily enzyme